MPSAVLSLRNLLCCLDFVPGRASYLFVGVHNTHDEITSHDVVALEAHKGDALDPGELRPCVLEAASLPKGKVHLGGVSRYDHLGTEPEAREEHLHLLSGGVLRLIEDDERVDQGSASHGCQRCDLDYTPLQVSRELCSVDQLIQSFVKRPEKRVNLGHHISR